MTALLHHTAPTAHSALPKRQPPPSNPFSFSFTFSLPFFFVCLRLVCVLCLCFVFCSLWGVRRRYQPEKQNAVRGVRAHLPKLAHDAFACHTSPNHAKPQSRKTKMTCRILAVPLLIARPIPRKQQTKAQQHFAFKTEAKRTNNSVKQPTADKHSNAAVISPSLHPTNHHRLNVSVCFFSQRMFVISPSPSSPSSPSSSSSSPCWLANATKTTTTTATKHRLVAF